MVTILATPEVKDLPLLVRVTDALARLYGMHLEPRVAASPFSPEVLGLERFETLRYKKPTGTTVTSRFCVAGGALSEPYYFQFWVDGDDEDAANQEVLALALTGRVFPLSSPRVTVRAPEKIQVYAADAAPLFREQLERACLFERFACELRSEALPTEASTVPWLSVGPVLARAKDVSLKGLRFGMGSCQVEPSALKLSFSGTNEEHVRYALLANKLLERFRAFLLDARKVRKGTTS